MKTLHNTLLSAALLLLAPAVHAAPATMQAIVQAGADAASFQLQAVPAPPPGATAGPAPAAVRPLRRPQVPPLQCFH